MAEHKTKYEISTEVDYNIRTGDYAVVHTHTYWEIVFVVEGSILNRIGSKTTPLSRYSAVLVKPDDEHAVRIAEADTRYINLEMRDGILRGFLEAIDPGLYACVLRGGNLTCKFGAEYAEGVDKRIHSLLLYGTAEEEQRELRRLFFRILFDMLPDREQTMREQQGSNDVIRKMFAVMEQEQNVALRLSDICRIMGYSESYLIRLFRAKLGTTPNREFTRIKLRYAAKLLLRTDNSVERIALMVGYQNKGHFYKLFGKEYGMLPYEYKKTRGGVHH